MIKRVLKELLAERLIIVSGLILMFILILALTKFQLSFARAESCGIDAFVFASRWVAVSVFPVSSLLNIAVNKNNFKPERVVLSEKNSVVWNYTVVKTVIMSLVIAVCIFIITLLCSVIFFEEYFNWSSKNSNLYFFTGYLMDDINYIMIFAAYFCQNFFGVCIAAMVPMITFWLFKSYVLGAIGTIIIIFTGKVSRANYIYGQDVNFDKMINGIDIREHFIYPVIVLIILMIAGSLKTKRDYI